MIKVFTMQANFKYLRTSKDRTHMPIWTFSEPVIKVFANAGDAMQAGFQKPRTRDKGVCKWGGAAPNPPAFFNTIQAVLKENRFLWRCFKSSYRQSVCKWGGPPPPPPHPPPPPPTPPHPPHPPPPPPPPPRLFTPCRLVFKNPEPVIQVFANGGGCPPQLQLQQQR